MSAPSFAVMTEITAHQMWSDRPSVPVAARLFWSPADPLTVRLCFTTRQTNPETVVWLFARDLLVHGLDGPVGVGDVRVFPEITDVDEPEQVVIALHNGRAYAEFAIDALAVRLFLGETLLRCPLGAELAGMDLDATIRALLDGPHGLGMPPSGKSHAAPSGEAPADPAAREVGGERR